MRRMQQEKCEGKSFNSSARADFLAALLEGELRTGKSSEISFSYNVVMLML